MTSKPCASAPSHPLTKADSLALESKGMQSRHSFSLRGGVKIHIIGWTEKTVDPGDLYPWPVTCHKSPLRFLWPSCTQSQRKTLQQGEFIFGSQLSRGFRFSFDFGLDFLLSLCFVTQNGSAFHISTLVLHFRDVSCIYSCIHYIPSLFLSLLVYFKTALINLNHTVLNY